VEYTA